METTLKEIKNLVRDMCAVGYKNKRALTEEQKILTNKIFDITLSIFSEIKMYTPSYTIQKNADLKKYRVEETEADEPSHTINAFLEENSDAFHEVVAYKYFGKRNTYRTENQLFYLKVYSIYCEEYCDVYVVSKSKKFWIVTDKKTDVTLVDFLNNYFYEFTAELRGKLEALFDDLKMEHDEVQIVLKEIAKELSEKSISKATGFRYGAITFMDFLGWKGLWQSRKEENHLESVSKLINQIKDVVQQYTYELFPYTNGMKISKFISISDTIAIFTPKVGKYNEEEIIELHARIARFILENCVKNKYAIRGAITFGMYNTKDSIMIGPGIDECASWHEACDWIGVHLTPSAELKINTFGLKENSAIEKYTVPSKKGYPQTKYCVQWQVNDNEFEQLTNEVKALLPEISSKYMNTYTYLHRKEEKKYG